MSTSRRRFLQSAAAAPLAAAPQAFPADLSGFAIARRHAIVRDLPTPNFFEGMLLGNGDIGICATVRPDALGIHIGKLDVWDIRVSEDHVKHVLPFPEILRLWKEAGEQAKRDGKPDAIYLENGPVMKEYTDRLHSSYDKPWPRPWPCGTVWVHWDSRTVRIVRQTLDIARAVHTLQMEETDMRGKARPVTIESFVSWDTGHISVSSDAVSPAVSVAYYPHIDRQTKLPLPVLQPSSSGFSCAQLLLATAPTDENPEPGPTPDDRTFAIEGRLAGEWASEQPEPGRIRAFLHSRRSQPLRLDLTLFTSLEDKDPRTRARTDVTRLAALPVPRLRAASESHWRNFWSKSAVEFADRELERIWYHNQYFLNLCLRDGKVAPGLFGNWSSGNIGTAWHGDYHMNYNTQQVFWGVFSSNHVDQHLPYVKLVEDLMPMAESNAKVMFGLPGAYFPHSAYPVPSKVNPYPVPPWGYEICETPWTVQSLWWHYLYTLDKEYLRRAYPMMKAATTFLLAYLKKGNDGRYHIEPTVSPENWGMTVDHRLNRDCIIDLALTEFLLDAMVQASEALDIDAGERRRWAATRNSLAEYPVADGPRGKVWLDIVNAPAEHVYNVPVTLAPVFPCEQVGLDRREELLELARNTARTIRLEGGNDLVWQPLARARLGILDFDWFKREVRYCLLPNGVANDRARQIDGRYRDETNFDFMMRMGVWTENLSLPVVLNECMMQSYSGIIRLFPNTRNLGWVRFANLRAVGAFLVSAAWDGSTVTDVRIRSERGAEARIRNPWAPAKASVLSEPDGQRVESSEESGVVRFSTTPGRGYRFTWA